jgi:hypothetical protein
MPVAIAVTHCASSVVHYIVFGDFSYALFLYALSLGDVLDLCGIAVVYSCWGLTIRDKLSLSSFLYYQYVSLVNKSLFIVGLYYQKESL